MRMPRHLAHYMSGSGAAKQVETNALKALLDVCGCTQGIFRAVPVSTDSRDERVSCEGGQLVVHRCDAAGRVLGKFGTHLAQIVIADLAGARCAFLHLPADPRRTQGVAMQSCVGHCSAARNPALLEAKR